MQTPGRRASRVQAWASIAAACSCRVSMARTPSRMSVGLRLQHGAAHDEEERVHALRLERPRQDL